MNEYSKYRIILVINSPCIHYIVKTALLEEHIHLGYCFSIVLSTLSLVLQLRYSGTIICHV